MRNTYKNILKIYFCDTIEATRRQRKLTQEKMAESLMMDKRSYHDLVSGKSCCSALTLVIYLLIYCDDIEKFFGDIQKEFENAYEDAG